MKIREAINTQAQHINTDDGDYIRFCATGWYKWEGSALESVYFEEDKLEKAYQDFTLESIPK